MPKTKKNTYHVTLGAFVRAYASFDVDAENLEAAKTKAIRRFMKDSENLDWCDYDTTNLAQPSIVDLHCSRTQGNEGDITGFDFAVNEADAREYAAANLLRALKKAASFIENISDDAENRQDLFFEAREAWRDAIEQAETWFGKKR